MKGVIDRVPSALKKSMPIIKSMPEICPDRIISPCDIDSGAGYDISAPYWNPMGPALIIKKPNIKADTSSSQYCSAKVTPMSPGIMQAIVRMIKFFLFLYLSESIGSVDAPAIPPTSIAAVVIPACIGVNPLGARISSIHVVTALNIPRPIKKSRRSISMSRFFSICLSQHIRPIQCPSKKNEQKN